MRRHTLIVIALLMIAIAAAGFLVAARGRAHRDRVYSVAGILDIAGQNPRAWDGRTVRVHGAIEPGLMLVLEGPGQPASASVAPAPDYLPLADGPSAARMLWVTYRQDDGLAALLHRLPLLAALAPGRRAPRVLDISTYRVKLHAVLPQCPSSICVLGTLVDFTAPALDPIGFSGGSSRPAAKH